MPELNLQIPTNEPTKDTTVDKPSDNNDDVKLLAGKYKSVEELEKGYQELQKKLGSNQNTETNGDDPNTPPEVDPKDVKDAATRDDAEPSSMNDAVTKASLEFHETGEVSEATRASLHKLGVNDEVINSFIETSKVNQQQNRKEVAEVVGGEENFKTILNWAGSNLSQEEKETYNEMLQSTNLGTIKKAVKDLHTQYNKANPNLLRGGGGGNAAVVKPFNSKTEVLNAMHDKRYGEDMHYTEHVKNRLSVTNRKAIR